MPIDSNIYAQFSQPVRSPAEIQNQLAQAAMAQNQVNEAPIRNALAQMQLSSSQIANMGAQQKMALMQHIMGQMGVGSPSQALQQPPGASMGSPMPANALAGPVGSPAPSAGSAAPAPAVGNMLDPRTVMLMKMAGMGDYTKDAELAGGWGDHREGSTWITSDGTIHRAPKLENGMVGGLNGVPVSNAPGYVDAMAQSAAAKALTTGRAGNMTTPLPTNYVSASTGQPVGGTIDSYLNPGAASGSAPSAPATTPLMTPMSGLSPQQQLAALKDMISRGQDPSTMKVNGQPATMNLAMPNGVPDELHQIILGQIQAQQDPVKRQQMIAQYTALGPPASAGVAPAAAPPQMSGSPSAPVAPGASGLQGPAQLAASKAAAEAEVKLKTQPNIDYATARGTEAAKYADSLDARVGSGQDLMLRIGEQRNAMDQFMPGAGAEARLNIARAAQAIGAPPDLVSRLNGGDIAAKQEFMKLSAQTAMESLKQAMGGSGRITQAEFKVFQANNPNISLDPNAIQKIWDFTNRVYQRDLGEQQGHQTFIKNGGSPADWRPSWSQASDPTSSGQIINPAQPTPPAPAPANYNGFSIKRTK